MDRRGILCNSFEAEAVGSGIVDDALQRLCRGCLAAGVVQEHDIAPALDQIVCDIGGQRLGGNAVADPFPYLASRSTEVYSFVLAQTNVQGLSHLQKRHILQLCINNSLYPRYS